MAALRGLLATVTVTLALLPQVVGASGPVVDRADVDGEINSITAAYIRQEVARAESDRATALLVVLNTPGGESDAMDSIVTALLNSRVPVIAYVAPPGARAASAGLFVAQAADVVAMAPGTNIGSAHPINGNGSNIGGDLGQKVLNDAVARIRDLAASHARNPDWAEQAVRQSVNVSAEDAVRLHVADLESTSVRDLLDQLDGRYLERPHAAAATLRTAGAGVDDHPMDLLQQLLHLVTDPNVAYLLMLVAIYGIIAEVSSPGAILPGTVGGISAVLALVALSGLPLQLAGLLLIGFAFLLFLADVKAATHGILTAGGVVALVLGSAFLINTGAVGDGVDVRLIAASAAVTLGLFVFVVRKAVEARSRGTVVGATAMVGALGEVRTPLDPDGDVFVAGRTWRAVAGVRADRGAVVRVTGVDGDRLRVDVEHDPRDVPPPPLPRSK